MSAKYPRVTWGNGCWAECVKMTDARRASDKPYRSWVNDARLYHGQVFGRDERGMFILRNVVFEDASHHLKDATILLYRLDINRGWVQCWEHSDTTRWAVYLFRNNNKTAPCTIEYRKAPRNQMAEVQGVKYFQSLR